MSKIGSDTTWANSRAERATWFIDADLAERYSYVNRSLPDVELDGLVDALARRIASFDKQAIADNIAPEWHSWPPCSVPRPR